MECLSKFEGGVCLNHANEVSFRLVGENWMAVVSGMIAERPLALPPKHHSGKLDA